MFKKLKSKKGIAIELTLAFMALVTAFTILICIESIAMVKFFNEENNSFKDKVEVESIGESFLKAYLTDYTGDNDGEYSISYSYGLSKYGVFDIDDSRNYFTQNVNVGTTLRYVLVLQRRETEDGREDTFEVRDGDFYTILQIVVKNGNIKKWYCLG